MYLLDLNADCLLHILQFCSERDLLNLGLASKQLQQIIDDLIFYQRSLDLLVCGHRGCPIIQQRTHSSLTFGNRISIARNWMEGRYREYEYFHHRQMFPTKMHLERDWLYLTFTGYLRKHRRLNQEPLQRRYQREITTGYTSDIADFVKKKGTIFAGRVCGSAFIFEDDYSTDQQLHSAKEYLYCVDFESDLYVTSTNVCAKFWRREEEFDLINLELVREQQKSYKALKLSEGAERLFGGLYTDHGHRALRELDVESGKELKLNSNTLSIYDLKLKDENVILTANFDTTFRMYDRRSNRDEAIWEDPFDSSFYCLEYDGLYAVLCGAKYHSRVNLYDLRVPGKYMQLYFPYGSRRGSSSPVYSIACDSQYLFVATDHNLRVFDFKYDCESSRDYRNIFSEIR